MKVRIFFVTLILTLTFSHLFSCGNKETHSATLPMPTELYAQIAQTVSLPDMLTLTAEELYDVIGIDPAWYTASAAYFSVNGTSPEEILIFLAVDETAADALENALRTRLKYKQDSAAQYLTENLPMLNDGIVRRDGLTVSLLVCTDTETVSKLYRP